MAKCKETNYRQNEQKFEDFHDLMILKNGAKLHEIPKISCNFAYKKQS